MMKEDWLWPALILITLAFGSAVYFHLVWSGSFRGCGPAVLTEGEQKTIASLDSIVDVGLKLATTLVGFGAALLIGLKSGLGSSPLTRTLVAAAVLLFAQSA